MIELSDEERMDRLQTGGIIDMHFDLPMDFTKNASAEMFLKKFFPHSERETSLLSAQRSTLKSLSSRCQSARGTGSNWTVYTETAASGRFAICKSYREIQAARKRVRSPFSLQWKESSRWVPT